jgi:hypothetical protein
MKVQNLRFHCPDDQVNFPVETITYSQKYQPVVPPLYRGPGNPGIPLMAGHFPAWRRYRSTV